MSSLGILVCIAFGIVALTWLAVMLGGHNDPDGALAVGFLGFVPVSLLVTAAFIVGIVQACSSSDVATTVTTPVHNLDVAPEVR